MKNARKKTTRKKTRIGSGRVVVLEGAESSIALAESHLELGRRLRNLYLDWTIDDEEPGECENSGSGADVAAAVFDILTSCGYPVN
jgi:hypothetical protein